MSIAVLSFFVWAHHMFVAGISIYSAVVFSLMTFFVAVPSAIKVFNWTVSLHKGRIIFDAPMLYALGFVLLFTIGGLTGLMLATLAIDVDVHGTYFVVAHFHYIMVGATVSAFFGGLHYWWPKMTGRFYPESWARFAAILTFVGFNLTFFPQFILGYLGMPRRSYTYPPEWQAWNVLSSAGASILAVAYVLPLFYLGWSLIWGRRAGPNPWRATGLEWIDLVAAAQRQFRAHPGRQARPLLLQSRGRQLHHPGRGQTCDSRTIAPEIQYADLPQQGDTAQLGMWVFLTTETLFFGALIFTYFLYRMTYPHEFAVAAKDAVLWCGSVNIGLI